MTNSGMPRAKSEELQQNMIKAVQKAMTTFQKAHACEVEDFTCYGMKKSQDSDRWLAYVCFNIKTIPTMKDDLNRQVLEQWIRDAIQASAKSFTTKTGVLVEMLSTSSHLRRTRMGQSIKMLGFHWHTQYP